MPVPEDVKSSWADEVELEGGSLPPTTELREGNLKIVTDYKCNDDDKKVKIIRTYKIEKRIVSKTIALRKSWPKFGECAGDKPGPDPATTIVGEDVYLQYISSKEEDNKQEEDALDKLVLIRLNSRVGRCETWQRCKLKLRTSAAWGATVKVLNCRFTDKLKSLGDKNVVKCRTCSGDHWTSKCPWKDTVLAGGKVPDDKMKPSTTGSGPSAVPEPGKPGGSKYVPPSMRDGATKRSDNPNLSRRDDTTAIRVSNLSESTVETDLEDLVKPFGPIQKLYLAKDKITGHCKGFAYIHFKFRNDAAKAIEGLHGHGYDHLILNVDWSKPPAHSNQ